MPELKPAARLPRTKRCFLDHALAAVSEASPDGQSGLNSAAADLLKTFPLRQFLLPKGFKGFDRPGALDLFSGSFGTAKALIRHGAPWVLCFEWKRSTGEDLLDEGVRNRIRQLLELGAVKVWGAAPICASFSVAVTPPVRSKRFLRGLPGLSSKMREKIRQGNSHNDFLADLIEHTESLTPVVGFWLENPDTSWWWRQKRFSKYRDPSSRHLFRCCFCRFGTQWRKATRIATNIKGLMGLRMMCMCRRPHQALRGTAPHGKAWTQIAEPYPRGLCEVLGSAAAIQCGWKGDARLDVAGCSRTGSLRAGEAKTPGPRRTRAARHIQLESIQLLSTTTLLREAKILEAFVVWVKQYVRSVELEFLFTAVPSFLVTALSIYGNLEFGRGGVLSDFRHLLLSCQRWLPSVRALIAPCWDLVSKWEMAEPVEHRVPIPEGLVKAMVAVAWQLKWHAWAGVTLLAFYGAGRVGEILKCSRADLVFPSDLMEKEQTSLFLQLRFFKSFGRQPARIQHMKITDATAIHILSLVFERLPASLQLYPSSPSVYRRRWDAILELCMIPTKLRLTPGGLRGGAAVMLYRRGEPVSNILWRLRLRSQTTLESYLQEMAANAVFTALRPEVRQRLYAFDSIYDALGFLEPGSSPLRK